MFTSLAVVLASEIPGLPGLTDIAAKLTSECGFIDLILIVFIGFLALELRKAQAAAAVREAAFLKLYIEQNETNEKLAIASARIEGMLASYKERPGGSDD